MNNEPGTSYGDIESALAAGVGHHGAGRLDEARRLYDSVLGVAPDHADALHLRGLIETQTGDHAAAAGLIGRAIAAEPAVAEYHNNLGIALRHLGRLDAAVAAYDTALSLKPDFAEAHTNLGIVRYQAADGDPAMACFRAALDHRPDYALALCGLGSLHFERREFAEAEARLRAAARADKGYAFAAACHLDIEYAARTGARTCDALIAEAAPVSGAWPAADGDGFVVMTACDPAYFRDYGHALALSLDRCAPGRSLHVHLFDADAAAAVEIESLGARLDATDLTVTWEAGRTGRAYYVTMRFVRLHQLVEACGRAVLAIDTDSLFRADIAPIGEAMRVHDVAVPTRFSNVQIHLKLLGGALYVGDSAPARLFLRRLAAYTLSCHRDGALGWYLDQLAIYVIYRMTQFAGEPITLFDLPAAFFDHALGDDALVWTGKGDRKSDGLFWRARGRVLEGGRP